MSNKYPLTEEQFKCLKGLENWDVFEIPVAEWQRIPNLPRMEDTIAVMASGGFLGTTLNQITAIIGLDILVHETRPTPGEKAGNAYHMVIQKISDIRYPYLMHGPFRSETLVPHHFDVSDLNIYFQDGAGISPSSPSTVPNAEQ